MLNSFHNELVSTVRTMYALVHIVGRMCHSNYYRRLRREIFDQVTTTEREIAKVIWC